MSSEDPEALELPTTYNLIIRPARYWWAAAALTGALAIGVSYDLYHHETDYEHREHQLSVGPLSAAYEERLIRDENYDDGRSDDDRTLEGALDVGYVATISGAGGRIWQLKRRESAAHKDYETRTLGTEQ